MVVYEVPYMVFLDPFPTSDKQTLFRPCQRDGHSPLSLSIFMDRFLFQLVGFGTRTFAIILKLKA